MEVTKGQPPEKSYEKSKSVAYETIYETERVKNEISLGKKLMRVTIKKENQEKLYNRISDKNKVIQIEEREDVKWQRKKGQGFYILWQVKKSDEKQHTGIYKIIEEKNAIKQKRFFGETEILPKEGSEQWIYFERRQ